MVLDVLERVTAVWRGDGRDFESGSDGSLFAQGPLDTLGRTSTAFDLAYLKTINQSITNLSFDNPEWISVAQNRTYSILQCIFVCKSIRTC